MTAASLMPMPKQAFYGLVNGVLSPIVGGKVYTYEAGTNTPKATYTTAAGTVANANPVILDSRGEASVWLGAGSYKIVLKDASDVVIWTQDGLSSDAAAMLYLPAGTGAQATTVQAKLREIVSAKDFGAVGNGIADDTAALQAFFDYVKTNGKQGATYDFSGDYGVTSQITIDVNGKNGINFNAGTIRYIGSSDLACLVYIKDAAFANFNGVFNVIGNGSITYTTRNVTDLIVTNNIGGARFDAVWARYAKRHGFDTGGKPGDTASHIGLDIGRCYFKECGSAIVDGVSPNIRLKQYAFTGRTDAGSGTSTAQRTTITITGGVDVLQEGGIFKYNGAYHYIYSVNAAAGTITFFPWLNDAATSGTIDSAHGAGFRNWGANSASVRVQGLKILGCGVGLDNDCLYGPHVSNLETQVTGVSYKQKGLCYGTNINVFHPETPVGDVDILKCDGFESRTTISGFSVYRPEDILQLFPVDASGNQTKTPLLGLCINPDVIPAFAGQKPFPTSRITSRELKNTPGQEFIVLRNRTSTTVSLLRDLYMANLFGYTIVRILRIGDSSNLVPGNTVIQPTTEEAAAGVTVMGAASYTVPALPAGATIICDLDVSRNDWRVYVSVQGLTQAATASPTGGAVIDAEARTAIGDIITKLTNAGLFS